MQTTPTILKSNDKRNHVEFSNNKPELVTSTTTKEPTITKLNNKEEVDALDDLEKRNEETEDEIKIIEEVNIESSDVTLRDMIKDRTKIDAKKQIRSMNNDDNKSNQKVSNKDPVLDRPFSTTPMDGTIKNETVKVTKAGHKIKLVHENEIQDNPLDLENILNPMPKYFMTRRIGGATYPTGNVWEWVPQVKPYDGHTKEWHDVTS